MTLKEAFEKYKDDDHLKRKSSKFPFSYPIDWLKDMAGFAELAHLGFMKYPGMEEDVKADDWELVTNKED